jgi:hypothetical protein
MQLLAFLFYLLQEIITWSKQIKNNFTQHLKVIIPLCVIVLIFPLIKINVMVIFFKIVIIL